MAMYSVWDYDKRLYTYYEANGPGGTHAGAAPIRGRTQLGAVPEQAAWRLPMGARRVGEGELPRGRIASSTSGNVLGDLPDGPVRIGLLAGAAYLAWRYLR